MRNLHAESPMQNQVMAVFEANAVSFELPLSATLEDLVGRLAHLSNRNGETLTGVSVRVSSVLEAGPRHEQSLR